MAWRALGWLVGGAFLAMTLGCPPVENGEDPPTLAELFPADGEVGNWTEDTGTGEKNHKNGSATEWWVAFYNPDNVQVADDLPGGFAELKAGNQATGG